MEVHKLLYCNECKTYQNPVDSMDCAVSLGHHITIVFSPDESLKQHCINEPHDA